MDGTEGVYCIASCGRHCKRICCCGSDSGIGCGVHTFQNKEETY